MKSWSDFVEFIKAITPNNKDTLAIEVLYQYWNTTPKSETLGAIGGILLFLATITTIALFTEWIEGVSLIARIVTSICTAVFLVVGIVFLCLSHHNGEELYYEVENSATVQSLLEDEKSGWDFVDRRGSIVTITQHETQ